MIELFLTIFCLFVSFVFSSKKMKIKSIVQVILSVVLTFIVLFLLPNAPFASFLEQKLGDGTLAVLQDVLNNIERYGINEFKQEKEGLYNSRACYCYCRNWHIVSNINSNICKFD